MPTKTNSEPVVVDIVNDSYGRKPKRTKKYIDLQNLQVLGESKKNDEKDLNNFDYYTTHCQKMKSDADRK